MKVHCIRGFYLIFCSFIIFQTAFSQRKWGKEDLSVYRKDNPFVALQMEDFPAHLSGKIIRSFDKNGIIIAQKDLIYFTKWAKSIHSPDPSFKLSPNLLEHLDQYLQIAFTGVVQFMDTSYQRVKSYWAYDFNWIDPTKGIARISNFPSLANIMNDPNVIYIERANQINVEGFVGFADLSLHEITAFRKEIPTNKIPLISIREGMIDKNDLDLTNQLIEHSQQPNNITTHATEMATILAGSGNSYMNALGVLPGANFLMESLFHFFPLMNDEWSTPLQLNSYGSDLEWFYSLSAQSYDEYISQNQKLFVFSSGNSGVMTPTSGAYKDVGGFSNLTGSFKQAKNPLIIGGVDFTYQPVAYSSSGPTYDGRVKPELVTIAENGTSVSAAIAVGIAAGIYALLPLPLHRNDLVKAILVASAVDIYTPGIDYKTGYGLINAKNAIDLTKNEHYWIDQLDISTINKHHLSVPEGNYQVRIALVWNDPPSTLQSEKALVNDLDFYLVHSQDTIHPWVLSNYPHKDSLNAMSVRGRDRLNNIELITAELVGGDYDIIVDGSRLIQNQSYCIAYQILPTQRFSFTHPIKDEVMLEGMNKYIRWNTDRVGKGKLYFKNVDVAANEWKLIDEVQLSFPIALMNDFSKIGNYLLKMEINEEAFVSDTFVIMPSTQLIPQYICDGQANFKISQQLYTPIKHQLEYFDTNLNQWIVTKESSDSILAETNLSSAWWRVKSQWEDKDLWPTASIYLNKDSSYCFQGTFLVDGHSNYVDLNFQLWSDHYIDRMEFQKKKGAEWVTIHQSPQIQIGKNEYKDYSLDNGANLYRAKLTLKNGELRYTDNQIYHHLKQELFQIYPNPVKLTQSIQVVIADPLNKRILIYNNEGKYIQMVHPNELVTSFVLNSTLPGIYYLVLYDKGIQTGVKKILVQ